MPDRPSDERVPVRYGGPMREAVVLHEDEDDRITALVAGDVVELILYYKHLNGMWLPNQDAGCALTRDAVRKLAQAVDDAAPLQRLPPEREAELLQVLDHSATHKALAALAAENARLQSALEPSPENMAHIRAALRNMANCDERVSPIAAILAAQRARAGIDGIVSRQKCDCEIYNLPDCNEPHGPREGRK